MGCERNSDPRTTTMTNDKIALQALLEKTSDASMLRDMISFAAERLMALETEPLCGAAELCLNLGDAVIRRRSVLACL